MADVAIPRNDCGVGLDDLERVCAVCWGGHGDGGGGAVVDLVGWGWW